MKTRLSRNNPSDCIVLSLSKEKSKPLQLIMLVNMMLRRKVSVFWVLKPFGNCLAGDFLIPKEYSEILLENAGKFDVPFESCEKPKTGIKQLTQPKIAVYHTGGYYWSLIHAYTLEKLGFAVRVCTIADIEKGALKQFNVLTIPGGYSVKKLKNLTSKGREQLKQFIYDGGGCFARLRSECRTNC